MKWYDAALLGSGVVLVFSYGWWGVAPAIVGAFSIGAAGALVTNRVFKPRSGDDD